VLTHQALRLSHAVTVERNEASLRVAYDVARGAAAGGDEEAEEAWKKAHAVSMGVRRGASNQTLSNAACNEEESAWR
jgi:phosphomannomutase